GRLPGRPPSHRAPAQGRREGRGPAGARAVGGPGPPHGPRVAGRAAGGGPGGRTRRRPELVVGGRCPMTAPVFVVDDFGASATGGTGRYVLDGPEGRHAVSVKRLRAGEHVVLTDGVGRWAEGEV